MEPMGELRRTHDCYSITEESLESEVTLMGWVHRRRDHGGLIFVDLRDREGITQVVFAPEVNAKAHEKAHSLRSEYVIAVRGKVRRRPEGMENPKIKTGMVEVACEDLRILNTSKTPPFPLDEEKEVSENVRLKYRYIDLRRPVMLENLKLRHNVCQAMRRYLSGEGFFEIETPMLTRSTPEGARDYLVPSRVNPGKFYALPQSPQLYKQILMISGMEKYFQIVRCFRDEDLRADRQPEFTQLDMEMSFVKEEDVIKLIEGLMGHIFKETLGLQVKTPFKRLTYHEAMERFGTDRPDMRFGLELMDITDIAAGCGLKVFNTVAATGGVVKAINAKGMADLSRKDLDVLTEFAQSLGAKGLAWVKIKDDSSWQSPIAKFFSEDEQKAIMERLLAEPGDILFFGADQKSTVFKVLGELRLELARKRGLIDENEFNFVWITQFPLLEFDEDEGRLRPFIIPSLLQCLRTWTDWKQIRHLYVQGRTISFLTVLKSAEEASVSTRRRYKKRSLRPLTYLMKRQRRSLAFSLRPSHMAPRPTAGSLLAWTGLSCLWQAEAPSGTSSHFQRHKRPSASWQGRRQR